MAGNISSIYTATRDWPAHLSVGAVLIDDKHQIAFHYFHPNEFDLGEVYLLMRETLHNNETLEAGIARGLREEFGASGKIMPTLIRCAAHCEKLVWPTAC